MGVLCTCTEREHTLAMSNYVFGHGTPELYPDLEIL